MINYLHDIAHFWAERILEDNEHSLRKNFDIFKETLDDLYLNQNIKHQVRDKFFILRQIKFISTYIIEFQQIIISLKFNDKVKYLLFYNDLKSIIKDALTLIDEEEKFKEFINQIIDIDQRQFHHLQEEKKISTSTRISFRTPESSSRSPDDQKRLIISDSSSRSLSKKYISFQYESFSEKEKKYRYDNNLYIYYINSYHEIMNYPLIPKKTINVEIESEYLNPQSISGKLIISSYYKTISLRSSNLFISIIQVFTYICIFLMISLIDFSFIIKVLLNSNTSLNLIHEDLIRALDLIIKFCILILIIIMNETKLLHINRVIILKFILIDIQYQEIFLITSFNSNQMILEISWLKRINLLINWKLCILIYQSPVIPHILNESYIFKISSHHDANSVSSCSSAFIEHESCSENIILQFTSQSIFIEHESCSENILPQSTSRSVSIEDESCFRQYSRIYPIHIQNSITSEENPHINILQNNSLS